MPERRTWKRLDYLIHRWTAIVLGVLLFSWFLSGIALMYYPWPALTESRQLATLEPLNLARDTTIVGFPVAAQRAGETYAGGRLARRGGRLLYELWRDERGRAEPAALADARSGSKLTPIDPDLAGAFARALVPASAVALRTDLLDDGDQYIMAYEYMRYFPAYRVRFSDPHRTAVYVSRDRGNVFAVVTARTRLTTWIGVVPHWLYFRWLYRRSALWTWLNILLPSAAIAVSLTGIVFGVAQLSPRHNGTLRLSEYRGVSNWHHLAGLVFGVLVLTWTTSGVLEMFGGGSEPRSADFERARGGAVRWDVVRLREWEAASATVLLPPSDVLAVDFAQLGERPGYGVQLRDGREFWVDATTGQARAELRADAAIAAARREMADDSAPVRAAERIASYDTYYYARPGRERHLPAWRVTFGDASHSVVYLNSVTGAPVGFVDDHTRPWRWLRDGLHSLDFPAINNRRPLWDAVVLPFMLGGVLLSGTGMWLVIRRLRRVLRS